MGAAAFLMVEYVGITYTQVIKHAFLPAIISYIALFYIVHLEALKADLQGLPALLADIEGYAKEDAWFWEPAPLLKQLVAEGRTFDDLNKQAAK